MTAETLVLPPHPPRSGTLPDPGTYRAEPGRCILEISASFGPLTTLRNRFAVGENRLDIAAGESRPHHRLDVEASRQRRSIRFASTGFEAAEPAEPGGLRIPGELHVRDGAVPLTLRARIVSRGEDRLLIIGTARIAYSQVRELCSFRLPRPVPTGRISLLLAADFR